MADYLTSVKKLFAYYKMLGEKAMEQVPDDKLHWQYNAESNSISVIVQHLSGNMLSRFTDFLTSDGEKEWRDREGEFENETLSREKLMNRWQQGWKVLLDTLDLLQEEDLDKEIFIRNMGHSVLDAINRQLAHYPSHVGQIIFISKMIAAEKWKSLSIPKGSSKEYNTEKFSKPKHTEHFTDELLSSGHKNAGNEKG